MIPAASLAVTVTAGVILAETAVLPGCAVITRLAAGPNTLKAVVVAGVKEVPVAVSVYPVPGLLIVKSLNVATPCTAGTVTVPPKILPLPPALLPKAYVIEAVESTVLPTTS